MRKVSILIISLLTITSAIAQTSQTRKQAEAAMARGDYSSAKQLYTHIIEDANDSSSKLLIGYSGRAKCNKQMALYSEALNDYEHALAIDLASSKDRNTLFINKSDLLIQMGAYDDAFNLLHSLNGLDAEQDIHQKANLSLVLLCQNQKDEALNVLNEVIARPETDGNTRAIAMQNRGYMHMSSPSPDYRLAVSDFDNALKSLEGTNKLLVLSNKAVAEAKIGLYKEAMTDIDTSLNGMAEIYGTSHPDYIRILRKKAEILMPIDKTAAKRIFMQYYEHEKNYVLSNFRGMTEQKRLDFWKKEKPLLSEIFGLEDEAPDFLLDVALFRRELALSGTRDISNLSQTSYSRMSINHKSIVSSLKSNEIAIDFVKYKKDDNDWYGAIIVSPNHKPHAISFIPLWSKEDFEDNTYVNGKTLHDAVCSTSAADKNGIYEDSLLADKVWGKIMAFLPKRGGTIYFAPDGLLHILAIENLLFAKATEACKDMHIHRLTSLANIVRRPYRGKSPRNGDILLLGGLDYDNTEAESKASSAKSNHDAAEYLSKKTRNKWRFTELDGMKEEIDSICKTYSNHNITPVSEYDMSEERLKVIMNKYGMVHFSTHGYALKIAEETPPYILRDSLLRDNSLLASGLALTGANKLLNHKEREDGILSARELCELNLSDVDFVILSACQTALGSISDEGPAGIVRGLKKAGVKTIVATLWEVDDKATCMFMKHFHTLLSRGTTKTEAIKATRTWLKNYEEPLMMFDAATMSSKVQHDADGREILSRPYEAPYYWAAFILIDDYEIN